MNYKVLTEGYTEIELENGDRIKYKLVIGSITSTGRKNPDGTPQYNFQHQLVSFVMPKCK